MAPTPAITNSDLKAVCGKFAPLAILQNIKIGNILRWRGGDASNGKPE